MVKDVHTSISFLTYDCHGLVWSRTSHKFHFHTAMSAGEERHNGAGMEGKPTMETSYSQVPLIFTACASVEYKSLVLSARRCPRRVEK